MGAHCCGKSSDATGGRKVPMADGGADSLSPPPATMAAVEAPVPGDPAMRALIREEVAVEREHADISSRLALEWGLGQVAAKKGKKIKEKSTKCFSL